MRILYDYQTFIEQSFGGVSRYINFLHKHITRYVKKSKIGVLLSNNDYLIKENIGYPFFPEKWFPKKLLIMRYINQQYSLLLMKSGKFDILHATYFDGYYFKKVSSPVVITVYDMIHEKLYDNYKELQDDDFIKRKKNALLNADMIIAISENTRKDVLEIYPEIKPEKIKTVHLCLMLDDAEKSASLSTEHSNEPFYLYVGNRNMYKDFYMLIDAVALIIQPEFVVMCAGSSPFTMDEINYMESKGVTSYFLHQEIVNDETLNQLYQQAISYVSTSAYEGFGLPVLEAFNNKCAEILRDNPCYKEIADNAAAYFSDSQQLALVLKKMFKNPEFKNDLINKGINRLKFFNREKLVKDTFACYETALNGRTVNNNF